MGTRADHATLVSAAHQGDKEAFAQLLRQHWSLLLSMCRRMLASEDLAEDAAQEAALQAYLSLGRLRRAESFGPWLSGIGLNVCRHRLRARDHPEVPWSDLAGGRYDRAFEIRDEQVGPHERAEAGELRARVQAAVAALPRGQRAAVVLYYLYGLTQTETAAHLGIEVSAVKTRLHKARGALRQHLLELWEGQQMTMPVPLPMVEMRIESVRRKTDLREPEEPPFVIFLEEVNGTRYLLLHVGLYEGNQLAASLNRTEMPRPMTFSFLASILQTTNVSLREVQINKMVQGIIYATALFDGGAGSRSVDARPSDALNLAALTGAPIRVASEVLESIGITIQKATIHDEHGQEVIEQTVRLLATGEEVDRVHLDSTTLAPVRVLVRRNPFLVVP